MNDETSSQYSLLRFSTAGSVDDGKSTLVGRLLHDSHNIFDDQIEALRKASEKHDAPGALALALLTDGLKAEREQGITIDVAYRYFSTPKRRFILADTPGHEQYTRNMATGASTADLAIILIDATKGVITQTKRHSFISSLLGIPRILVAINKMDLVDYSHEVFEKIRKDYMEFASRLTIREIRFIPISALAGDNVVERSTKMPWYHGEPVLEYLENVYIGGDRNKVDFRFPVQLVLRDGTWRGYAGQVASGNIRVGEEVIVLPAMRKSRLRSVEVQGKSAVQGADAPQSVVLTLEDEIDISRGDMIVRVGNMPHMQTQFEAMVVWMGETPLDTSRSYLIMHTTKTVKAHVDAVRYRIDINSLSRLPGAPLNTNEIGRLAFTTAKPLLFDTYEKNRATGNFILVDAETNLTVAGGMFIDALPEELLVPQTHVMEGEQLTKSSSLHFEGGAVSRKDREQRSGHRAVSFWCTGLSGSGKSTIARFVEKELFSRGVAVFRLDGDNMRMGLNRDLGFSTKDRAENIRRTAEVAKLLNEAGVSVICSLISPFERDRALARSIIGPENFLEIYMSTPITVCEARDPHGLYRKARSGEIKEFTGVNAPYEAPTKPDLSLSTDKQSIEECVEMILKIYMDRTAVSTAS